MRSIVSPQKYFTIFTPITCLHVIVISTYRDGCVITVSTTVPGGGFAKSPFSFLMNNFELILFVTTINAIEKSSFKMLRQDF